MDEVFVIERMVVVGVWELVSDTFYTNEGKALDVCLDITEKMRRTDPNFVARVKKLVISNKYMKAKEEENENVAYPDMGVDACFDVVDPHLCFDGGMLFVYVQHGLNTAPERRDVTEEVAKAIAKYLKEEQL